MVNFKNLAVTATALLSGALAAPMVDDSGSASIQAESTISGSYIVTLKDGVDAATAESHIQWVGDVHKRSINKRDSKGVEKTYTGNFNGYAGSFDESTLQEIRNNPDVAAVEEDQIWSLAFVDIGTASEPVTMQKRALTTQSPATYGLAAVSHRESGNTEYIYDTKAGQGTYAYVVDSGVRLTHNEFEGRATLGFTAFPGEEEDTLGHGTHVAGTIGSKTYGVAKKANLISVKVFKGRTASTSTILSGYNWAVNDIKDKGRQNSAVINMSLGGPVSSAFNNAVDNASAAGVLSIIAAGNERQNAANVSPASASSAVTVGAVSSDWSFASSYSNYGSVLDIFGPGTGVLSTWYTSDSATNSITGTSMATPHIVGLASYAISVDGITGVSAITNHLINSSTKNKITGNLRGSPNRLGNNNNSQQ